MASRLWSEKENKDLTRAELTRVAEFWHDAAVRWMDWAKLLVPSPPNGMWGSDTERKLIGGEIRWRRKKMRGQVFSGLVKETERFARDVRRMMKAKKL